MKRTTRTNTSLTSLSLLVLSSALLLNATPVQAADVVQPLQTYTYDLLQRDIERLAAAYPGLITYKSIGKTPFGREIYAVKLGKGEPSITINGSHHAREWLSTNLNMYMLDRYAEAYSRGGGMDGYNVRELLDKTSIWFVPMVNPDGVTLVQYGADAFPDWYRGELVRMNEGSSNFKRWKANAQGIDLNRQYNADWANIQYNIPWRNWYNHKGDAPEQAPETKAMVAFTNEINPMASLAYHSSGQILYWHFHNRAEHLARDTRIAGQVSAYTGYFLVRPTASPSGGGYTDWFIQQFGRPALTPELGKFVGDAELPLSVFPDEWNRNRPVGLYMVQEGFKVWWNSTPTEPFNQRIYVGEDVGMFTDPTWDHNADYRITPQNVNAFEKKGNWYHIRTWVGDQWVHVPNAYPAITPTPVQKRVALTATASLYSAPFEPFKSGAAISPQTVTVFEEWNGWYHIRTWAGDRWIIAQAGGTETPVPPPPPATTEKKIALTQVTPLYERPSPDALTKNAVTPQTVTAYEERDGWARIKTWLGDHWIQL